MRPSGPILGLALSCGRLVAQEQAERVTAFVDVNLVAMDDARVQSGQTVLVARDRIVRVGPVREVSVPAGAQRIDGRGKYLIPGLSDMHVHFGGDSAANRALLDLYAAYGVTTVFNLSGTPSHLELRDRVARGELLGPTIYTSGPIHDDSSLTFADGERLVEQEAAAGYQFIKVYNRLSRAAYWGIVSTARRVGIPVVGHVVRGLDSYGLSRCEPTRVVCFCEHCLELTLASGQKNIVHMEEITYGYFNYHATKNPRNPAELESLIPGVAAKLAASGIWLTPTLEAYKNVARQVENVSRVMAQAEMRYMPRSMRDNWQPGRNPYEKRFRSEQAAAFWEEDRFQEKLTKAFADAGVKLLAGTDAGIPSVIAGLSLHWELQHFVRSGLTPYQALVTATRNPAAFFGTADQTGTVTQGKVADLILLDANPLVEIENTERRAGVMIRGKWLPRDSIDGVLDRLATH